MRQLKISIITVIFILAGNSINAQEKAQKELNPAPLLNLGIYVSPLWTHLISDTYDYKQKNSLNYDIGADFIYYYYNKDRIKASISLGLGFIKYGSSLNVSYEYSNQTIDADGQEVNLLTERVDNMEENQKLSYISIPLKLGIEYEISSKLDAYGSVGAIYGLALKGKYTNEAKITRTGFYPAYNALIYDVDEPGSPYFYPTNKKLSGDGKLNIKKNISFQLALGVKHNINSMISGTLGFNYILGLSDVIDENSPFIVSHNDAYQYSLNSLSSRGDKTLIRGFGIEIGVQLDIRKILN